MKHTVTLKSSVIYYKLMLIKETISLAVKVSTLRSIISHITTVLISQWYRIQKNLPTATATATATTATCSCSSTSEPIQSSTIIMVTVLIFIILVQTVIIILVLLCSCAMRRTARNPKVQQNIRQAQFHENNLAIPLEDIIEKQPYATPDTMEKIQGNSEITSIPKCENIY